MTPDWEIVATVKAPVEKVAAFVAHHISLGAAQIRLFLDDPTDPGFAEISALPRTLVTRCDDAHWQALGRRPERHQNRQSKNAQAAYKASTLPWLAHIDVDEFLWLGPGETVADILASLPSDQLTLRMEPYEAMHDPDLPDDILSARLFRGPLKPRFATLRPPALGEYETILPEGHLSHTNGKSFFRTGIRGLSPRLHGAFRDGARLAGPPFDPRLALLHFHAQDRQAWLEALPFRLTRGAYQYHAELQAHLQEADAHEISRFYDRTQQLAPETAQMLHEKGRLIEAALGLRHKVSGLSARSVPASGGSGSA